MNWNSHGPRRNTNGLWIVTCLVLLFVVPACVADEFSLLLNGFSQHVKPPAGTNYNENNFGLGFQYEFKLIDGRWVPFVTASGFRDSERNASYYAGGGVMRRIKSKKHFRDMHLDVGFVGFVMTRKTYNDGDPFIAALPAASIGTERFSVNISYIPRLHPKISPLWFFQFKIPLSRK